MANLDSASASAAQQADTKPCPNCGKGLVPKSEPDSPPWFGPPPRLPKDNETVLSSSDFLNTGKRALGKGANARVFIQKSTGRYCYRDKLHTGKGAELEVFDRQAKKHLGTMCSMCGHFSTQKQDSKKDNKLHLG